MHDCLQMILGLLHKFAAMELGPLLAKMLGLKKNPTQNEAIPHILLEVAGNILRDMSMHF